MKEIVVLSGKGGTGKTSVLAALAHLAARGQQLVLADADVDAANLGLVLAPEGLAEHQFVGGKLATIAADLCTGCGACLEACRFAAIRPTAKRVDGSLRYSVDPLACEGCAACFYRCPANAVALREQVAGRWFVANTRFGTLVHAHLFAGQENSGKLVMLVKQQARELARRQGADYLLVDGPPGIGCPVIAACSGADLALLVAEPTVAGIHDLERILATTEHFRVRALVCINKSDLNSARSREIERFCADRGVEVVGRVPFDSAVTAAMVQGLTIGEWAGHGPPAADGRGVASELAQMWGKIEDLVLRQGDSR
jgi:MinD superfamily P-loop ATPase